MKWADRLAQVEIRPRVIQEDELEAEESATRIEEWVLSVPGEDA